MSDAKTEMTIEREDGSRYVLRFDRRDDCLIVMERLQAAGKLKLLKSRVAALLQRIESADDSRCPCCHRDVGEGFGAGTEPHAPDCELAALLKECAS